MSEVINKYEINEAYNMYKDIVKYGEWYFFDSYERDLEMMKKIKMEYIDGYERRSSK